MLRAALLLADDRAAAEDLVQTCFLKLFDHWRRNTIEIDKWKAYALRTLVHVNISHHRLFRTSRESATAILADPQLPGPEDSVVNEHHLVSALKTLTTKQRSAVVLRFCYDYSEKQTASLMQVPIGTVKSLTARGIAQLRDQLRHNDHGRSLPASRNEVQT